MYDLAIIGLGPAGLEALNISLKNDLNVIAFEKAQFGGTCLNKGCIPTKALLHSANLLNEIRNSSQNGINIDNFSFDWDVALKRKNDIVLKFNKALELAYKKNVTIINSLASLKFENDLVSIEADNQIYHAKNIIIASGSTPVELPELKFNGDNILSSDDILSLKSLPKSIAIIGSGAIGLEIATFLKSFGVDVTIIEKAQNLAPAMDIEIQKRIERILKQTKINYFKDDYVVEFENNIVKLNSSKEFVAQKLLVAVGRKQLLPTIKRDDFKLVINSDFTTNIPNVFVIGDATKQVMLAHNASFQAKVVMNKILFNKTLDLKNIPSVVYTTPEIASIGLKEQEIDDISKYVIKKIMVGSIAKSWCEDANDGVIKVIIKDECIVGAHIVSKNASILISIFNILIDKKIKLNEIEQMIFPHPCFSELIQEVIVNGK